MLNCLGKQYTVWPKIGGDEIYIESTGGILALRTVNSSSSAYASFAFDGSFFSANEAAEDSNSNYEEKCKVMFRELLSAFKSLSNLEKTVDSCILATDTEESKLLISLICRHSVKKRFLINLVDCKALKAVYDINRFSNKWIFSSKVMNEANGNFLSNQEEETMHVNGNSFKLENYNARNIKRIEGCIQTLSKEKVFLLGRG